MNCEALNHTLKNPFLMIKKFYFILFVLATVNVNAQNLVYTPEQHRVDTVLAENFEAYDINISTPNPEAITYKWVALSNTLLSSWSYSLCDFGACYVGIPSGTNTMDPISLSQAQAGSEGFLKINITVGQNYGYGKVVFYVYDQANINRGDTISFEIYWPAPTAVSEIDLLQDVSLYPNPATDKFIIENASGEELTLSIFTLTGQLVSTEIFSSANFTKDVSALEREMYIVVLENTLGNKKITRLVLG